jgi:hypothetical protein
MQDLSKGELWRDWNVLKSLEASERLKEEFLHELQAEHNDLQFKTDLSKGCN